MYSIALKMLFHDRAKYLGLVLGVAFSTLLINQQLGIFIGLITRAGAVIVDVPQADVWVMDPGVKNLDTIFPLRDTELGRVRGVPGVAWAVPLYKSNVTIRTGNGELESSLLIGVDDSTLIGLPPEVVLGNIDDLRRPDAVAVSMDGYRKIWRNGPLSLGNIAELNDRRAVVVAIVKDSPKFTSSITFFTRYSQALGYTNNGRNQMSFIVARSAEDSTPAKVAQSIVARTGLQAMSAEDFRWKAIMYVVQNTGIPISIGTVVALGVLVGIAVVGLMFNLFVLENLKQFAVLKAIGTSNIRLMGMVFLQAAVVGFVGFSLGLFGATMFFETAGKSPTFQGFYLPWYVSAASGAVAAAIIVLAAMIAMRRVLFVDPAIVFRG